MQYMHELCYITELQRVKLFFETLLENIIFYRTKRHIYHENYLMVYVSLFL